MKRLLLFLLLISLITLSSCGSKEGETTQLEKSKTNTKLDNNKTNSNDIFEIREKMFISQCNDIYLNTKDYEGKTVKIEGFCDMQTDPKTGKVYYGVIRKGPGCCGNDGVAGFEFAYEGQCPKKNDWLEVIGKIAIIKRDADDVIIIQASKVTVKDTRGADFVSN